MLLLSSWSDNHQRFYTTVATRTRTYSNSQYTRSSMQANTSDSMQVYIAASMGTNMAATMENNMAAITLTNNHTTLSLYIQVRAISIHRNIPTLVHLLQTQDIMHTAKLTIRTIQAHTSTVNIIIQQQLTSQRWLQRTTTITTTTARQ